MVRQTKGVDQDKRLDRQAPSLDWLDWPALSAGFPGMSTNGNIVACYSTDYIAWLWAQYPHF